MHHPFPIFVSRRLYFPDYQCLHFLPFPDYKGIITPPALIYISALSAKPSSSLAPLAQLPPVVAPRTPSRPLSSIHPSHHYATVRPKTQISWIVLCSISPTLNVARLSSKKEFHGITSLPMPKPPPSSNPSHSADQSAATILRGLLPGQNLINRSPIFRNNHDSVPSLTFPHSTTGSLPNFSQSEVITAVLELIPASAGRAASCTHGMASNTNTSCTFRLSAYAEAMANLREIFLRTNSPAECPLSTSHQNSASLPLREPQASASGVASRPSTCTSLHPHQIST